MKKTRTMPPFELVLGREEKVMDDRIMSAYPISSCRYTCVSGTAPAQRGHSAVAIDTKKVNFPPKPGYTQIFDAGQNGFSVRYLRDKGA